MAPETRASKVMEFDVFCMNFKGDWKYLWQLFSLNRYATKEEAGVLNKMVMILFFPPKQIALFRQYALMFSSIKVTCPASVVCLQPV